jgi:predicted secreted Zn-dependent protease
VVSLLQGRVRGLFLVALLALVALACGNSKSSETVTVHQAAAAGERVHLNATTSTKHYAVRGTNSDTIFDYIERNGPTDDAGQRGSGLTTAKVSYTWKGSATRQGCGIASLTVSLDLTVTLPQHESSRSLSPAVLRSWERFVADVSAHEQHHVDIYLAGAETIKEKMAAIEPKPSCDLLEREIAAVWAREQRTIDDQQEAFHRDEEARLAAERRPLQTQIETNRGRIRALAAQIRAIDSEIESLNRQIKEAQDLISPLKSQMESIEGAYGTSLPPNIYSRYENLRSQYNALIVRYNSLVGQHNTLIDQRSKVAAEHDRLVSTTEDLVEELSWKR